MLVWENCQRNSQTLQVLCYGFKTHNLDYILSVKSLSQAYFKNNLSARVIAN